MRGRRVLIIDDDDDICRLLHMLFAGAGAIVTTTTSAAGGLDLLGSSSPDLVIMDLLMPGVNRWELVRSIHQATGAPILVLSGLADPDMVACALDCGASDYVTKPFSLAVLVARAKAVVRKSPAKQPGNGQRYVSPAVEREQEGRLPPI